MKRTENLAKAGLVKAAAMLVATGFLSGPMMVHAETISGATLQRASLSAAPLLHSALSSLDAPVVYGAGTPGSSLFFGLPGDSSAVTNPYILFADVLSLPSLGSERQVAASVLHFEASNSLLVPGPVPLPKPFWLLLASAGLLAALAHKRGNMVSWNGPWSRCI
ncbi:MAG: hypothetical protein P4L83_12305 [Nevskia sp.]|nr:hypothetical protein [Nevskia sp.]